MVRGAFAATSSTMIHLLHALLLNNNPQSSSPRSLKGLSSASEPKPLPYPSTSLCTSARDSSPAAASVCVSSFIMQDKSKGKMYQIRQIKQCPQCSARESGPRRPRPARRDRHWRTGRGWKRRGTVGLGPCGCRLLRRSVVGF